MCTTVPYAFEVSVCVLRYMQTLKSCSENFPIQNYTVRVVNLTSEFIIPSFSLPLPGNEVSLQLNNTVLPDLTTDVVYSVCVDVCSDFSCKPSEPVMLCECVHIHQGSVSVVSFPGDNSVRILGGACVHVQTCIQGFLKVIKSCSHFWKILPTNAAIKSQLYRDNGKNWLLNPGTSSQSEGYSSKWLVCREPLQIGLTSKTNSNLG